MKLKLTKNQQKVLAEIFEKVGLGLGTATLINSFLLDKPTICTQTVIIFGLIAAILITLSVYMRK